MTDARILTFDREFSAPAERVRDALTSPAARMAWGPPDADSIVVIEDQPKPAEGVREISRCGPRDNPYVTVWTDWIVMTDERLTYAETLLAEGTHLGVTLATCDIAPLASGSRLTLTLQIVSYVGEEMFAEFEGGWTHAIGNLEAFLGVPPQ